MPARKTKKYEQNPFRQETVNESDPRTKTVIATVKGEDGHVSAMLMKKDNHGNVLEETPAGLALFTPKTVEVNEFIKIYTKGIAGMFGLNRYGQKVFALLFEELAGPNGQDRDMVTLQYSALPQSVKDAMSYAYFSKGINDLIKNRFLAESIYTYQYYVNPTYIYNGDRMAIVTVYKKQLANERHEEHRKRLLEKAQTDKNGTRFIQPNLDLGEPGPAPWEEEK